MCEAQVSPMNERMLAEARKLISDQRWAALATTGSDEHPLASMVAYAREPATTNLLLHLSRLARHTRNLAEHPTASLVVCAPDTGAVDPQTLARISLFGRVSVVHADAPDHAALRMLYVSRLPASEPRFEFGDFTLYRFAAVRARYVGGFGRAHTFDAARLSGTVPA